MIVKVCGMREDANAQAVAALGVDCMGFIFFERSQRFVGDFTPSTPSNIARVGVFVDAELSYIEAMVEKHSLDYVQLHGKESVEVCREIKSRGAVKVIKAISVAGAEDFELASLYDGEVDYLLFDTKCDCYGGSGVTFDWSLLENYRGETPFLLSGGIDESMAEQISEIRYKSFAGVDLNSRFEVSPAFKNIEKLRNFIEKIRSYE